MQANGTVARACSLYSRGAATLGCGAVLLVFMSRHDIVVIGASAGGPQALTELLGRLPANLPAAVFVVVHGAPQLMDLFSRQGRLSVCYPRDHEEIRHGMIYLPPVDHHLLLKGERVRVTRGPRENAWRPSINVLFRSAAVAGGSRVIGIVLSGSLDDGALGLAGIRRCGGITIIQDPAEATVPDMPQAAAAVTEIDHTLTVARIAELLPDLTRSPAPASPPAPLELVVESRVAEGTSDLEQDTSRLGELSGLICPECSGPLWDMRAEKGAYRCQVGHAYSLQSLVNNSDVQLEQTLWAAIRMFEQRAMLTRQMIRGPTGNKTYLAKHFEGRAHEADTHARTLRNLVFAGAVAREPDLKES